MGRATASGFSIDCALTTIVAFALLSITTGAVPQEPSTDALSFEVASVRPNTSGGFSFVGVQVQPSGAVTAENVSLRRIIAFAYGLDVYQAVEGRSKLLDQNFDVSAKTAPDVKRVRAPEIGPVNFMMQKLLSQRFKLAVRWENRVLNGYSLVRAKPNGDLGSRIKSSEFVCPRPVDAPTTPAETRRCAIVVIGNELSADGQRMSNITRFLSTSLGRPVLDGTGLTDVYDVRMTFDAAELAEIQGLRPIVPEEVRSRTPSLFTAIQEQWGLRLEPRPVDVPTLIVEHVESPSEN